MNKLLLTEVKKLKLLRIERHWKRRGNKIAVSNPVHSILPYLDSEILLVGIRLVGGKIDPFIAVWLLLSNDR
jgi:hypothetical protein